MFFFLFKFEVREFSVERVREECCFLNEIIFMWLLLRLWIVLLGIEG